METFDDVAEAKAGTQAVSSRVRVCGLTELGHVLKALREGRGVSQESVSRMSGVHVSTIQRLESGRDEGFKTETVERVLTVLGVSLELLLRERPAARG